MTYTIADRVLFGKYKGLTIQEIFQDTLSINKAFIVNYLEDILNNDPFDLDISFGSDANFVETFLIDET